MFDWDTLNIECTTQTHNTSTDIPVLAPLKSYALITVSGVDSEKFLQGQCTCDFTSLSSLPSFETTNNEEKRGILGAHCTPKGRMVASFVAAKIDEQTIGLRVHSSIVEKTLSSLKKYGVFSKVDFTISSEFALFGMLNPSNNKQELDKKGIYIHTPFIQEFWLDISTHSERWQHIKHSANFVDEPLWQLKNIEAGVGEIRGETSEQLLPQEINFQLTDGISFKKGCYTGQEIVARMHYKAQLKKHMYRAEISSSIQPFAGTSIQSISDTKKVGTVIFSAKKSASEYELLVLANDSCLEDKSAILSDKSQAKLRWLPLPYAIN